MRRRIVQTSSRALVPVFFKTPSTVFYPKANKYYCTRSDVLSKQMTELRQKYPDSKLSIVSLKKGKELQGLDYSETISGWAIPVYLKGTPNIEKNKTNSIAKVVTYSVNPPKNCEVIQCVSVEKLDGNLIYFIPHSMLNMMCNNAQPESQTRDSCKKDRHGLSSFK